MQTAAHRQEEARLATLRALEDSCVAGDLAAVRAVVSAMDPSAATALVNHAASGRNTLLFKVGDFALVQGYSYDQLIGWVDLDLGSSPGWWPIL